MPSNPGTRTERKIFPMFSRCKMARTPGIFSAAVVSSLTTRPLAIVDSTGTAYSIPGKWKSEVYCAFPLTFNGPSTRGVSRPIGEAVGGMFAPSVESTGRGDFQGVGETPLGQLDLEPILALRLGVAQGSFRRLAKVGYFGGLADESGLGFGRSP